VTLPGHALSYGPVTVVHLITTLTQGGAERVLSQMVPRPCDVPHDAAGVPRERHVVVSLVDGGMFADELVTAGVEVRGLGMRPGRDVVRGAVRLATLLRELRPALVVSWMYHACLLDLLARPLAGRARRARMVWMLRSALEAPETLSRGTRVVISLLARFSRVPDEIVTNSVAGRLQHAAHGYRPRRWSYLPNGCDTRRFRPDATDRAAVRDELEVSDAEILLLYVGRAHPEKGLGVLLDALPSVPTPPALVVALIGEGTEGMTHAVGSTRVIGMGGREDVDRLIRGADLFVMPSRSEGTSNAVIEAMASEVPCVVTDVGDSADLVADTGIVVLPGSPSSLAVGVAELIAAGPTERSVRGHAARQRILSRHALDVARVAYATLWTEKLT
jgi:glycosyltransferase involved in cell wall biosynthesis